MGGGYEGKREARRLRKREKNKNRAKEEKDGGRNGKWRESEGKKRGKEG